MTSVRESLADAASTVDGISVTPYFRQSTKPGDGYVRLDRTNRDSTGFGFINVWQVLIILPGDLAGAEKFLEARVEALLEALNEEVIVISVTPQQLVLDTGTLPVVVIEGNRAS